MCLVVIAPDKLVDSLNAELGQVFTETILVSSGEPSSNTADPYGLDGIIGNMNVKPDGVLLVVPKKRSPGRTVPSILIHGVPVGIIQADTIDQIMVWLESLKAAGTSNPKPVWASLAMAKDFYLKWGQNFIDYMKLGSKGENIDVEAWFADAVTKEEVCNLLSKGPKLAIYAGHGRSRGWSAYRALRWEHVAAAEMKRPCGTVVSLACDTLKKERGNVPFGCRWVNEGRACSYLGSVSRLGVKANEAFAQVLGDVLSRGSCKTIGQLLAAVEARIANNPEFAEARRGFMTYRLMGNPLQPLY